MSRLLLSLMLLTLPRTGAGAVPVQGGIVDEAEFEVRRAGNVVGREAFAIRELPGTGGRPRLRLTVAAWYPADAGAAILQPTLELDEDSLPRTLQLEVAGAEPRRYFVSLAARRITVRIVTAGGEAAREYPNSPRNLVADDSALTLYAVLPSRAPGPIRLFHPRSGGRTEAALDDLGRGSTRLRGAARELQHYVVRRPDRPIHLWYDARGRLMKVEIPAAEVVAERIDG